jgi:hypothetical protein
MHYLVTVGYESEQLDREGNPRLQKIKYVVEADSVEEANIVMAKFRGEDMRSSQCLSIIKMAIDSVISSGETPQYYNK